MTSLAARLPRHARWIGPAVLGVATLAGAAWWLDPPAGGPPAAGPAPAPQAKGTVPPQAAGEGAVYSVSSQFENGTKVVLIQAVRGGDVLVVDAATGRLIETRPPGAPVKAANAGVQLRPVE